MGGAFSKSSAMTVLADPRYTRCEKLLPNEQALLQQGPSPIGTITWMEGSQADAAKELHRRLKCLCHMNPWLTGRIVWRGKKQEAHIVYPPRLAEDGDDDDLMDCLFTCVDAPLDGSIHHEEADFTKLPQVLSTHGALLMPKRDTEQPLIRVSMIPSSRTKSGKTVFGVVVSMSHVVVDGHSYYQIYNALMNENDPTRMPRIQVERITESPALKDTAIGKENLVFLAPGMLASLVGGLLYDMLMWPLRKSQLRIEKSIAFIDTKKIIEMKRYAMAKGEKEENNECKFVSTNDIVTSWFLSKSKAHYGFMAINLRDRLKGHSPSLGGNYSELLFYRTPSDTLCPTFVRQSLTTLKRTQTINQKPSFFELATGRSSFVTNWASFASGSISIPGSRLVTHFPMVDLSANVMPSTMAFCVIFRAKADQLGVLFAGAAYRMQDMVKNLPFSCGN
ncbi:MAG: hypothetical protein SGILL_002832 [Bacillariaceae sp.]